MVESQQTFKQDHYLTKQLKAISWNNIPLPLKEMFEHLVDYSLTQEVLSRKSKMKTNDRIL